MKRGEELQHPLLPKDATPSTRAANKTVLTAFATSCSGEQGRNKRENIKRMMRSSELELDALTNGVGVEGVSVDLRISIIKPIHAN